MEGLQDGKLRSPLNPAHSKDSSMEVLHRPLPHLTLSDQQRHPLSVLPIPDPSLTLPLPWMCSSSWGVFKKGQQAFSVFALSALVHNVAPYLWRRPQSSRVVSTNMHPKTKSLFEPFKCLPPWGSHQKAAVAKHLYGPPYIFCSAFNRLPFLALLNNFSRWSHTLKRQDNI